MLNKLLKRHAPWMDKGRWYQIRIAYDGSVVTPIYDTDEFVNVEIKNNNEYMTVTCKHVFQIVEYKFCPNGSNSAYCDGQLRITSVAEGDDFSNYKFNIKLWGPGTYWFFMR